MGRNPALMVTKEQVRDALEYLIKNNVVLKPSTKFNLVYKDKAFPPKEVVRYALKLGNIQGWNNEDLNGGPPTNEPLTALGFTIVPKSGVASKATFNMKKFIDQLKQYIETNADTIQYGSYQFVKKDNQTSFSTAGGVWDPKLYPGYVFTGGDKSYLIRLITFENHSYITVESLHTSSQLITYKLVEEENFRITDGIVYLSETYLMTVRSRVSFEVAKAAMREVGFSDDDIITSFKEHQFDENEVIKQIL